MTGSDDLLKVGDVQKKSDDEQGVEDFVREADVQKRLIMSRG